MARLTAGITTSHVPAIGAAIDNVVLGASFGVFDIGDNVFDQRDLVFIMPGR